MADELLDKIRNALKNLVTLEIVTCVGDIVVNAGSKSPDIDYSKNPKMILTRIDLLQGDIRTVFHEEYVTGSYQALREFHAAREKEGYEMIKANMAALEKLWYLANEFKEK